MLRLHEDAAARGLLGDLAHLDQRKDVLVPSSFGGGGFAIGVEDKKLLCVELQIC